MQLPEGAELAVEPETLVVGVANAPAPELEVEGAGDAEAEEAEGDVVEETEDAASDES